MKLAASMLALAAMAFTGTAAEPYPDVTVADLQAAIKAGPVVLLDANGTASWKQGHIPGAIDFAAHKADLAKLLPADKATLIVAYCGGPKCMAYKDAAAAAVKLGYQNVKHLSAGISGWVAAKAAVEQGS